MQNLPKIETKVLLDDFNQTKDIFLEDLNSENELFIPMFIPFINKKDLWYHIIEPRIRIFHEYVISKVKYPEDYSRTLDGTIISILQELNTINQAIFQIALVLIGEAGLSDDFPIPLFDLDDMVEPYMLFWLENLKRQFNDIAVRCLSNDRGEIENERLK